MREGVPRMMTRAMAFSALLLAGLLLPATGTAEQLSRAAAQPSVVGPHPPIWRYNGPPQEPPFPRSHRSEAIYASGACWTDCGAYCAWNLNGCLYKDSQGICILYSAACDRYCQRACRTEGGPFLPID